MSIGIVIPAYNAAGFLSATLDSVRGQTHDDWELIVVDDGSRDNTAALVDAYAARDERISLIRRANGGVANARNTGAAAFSERAEYVIFLDHDDVWMPDTLETLIDTLNASPHAIGAHGLARKIDIDGAPLGEGEAGIQNYERRRWENGNAVNAARNAPTTAAMVVYDNLLCTPGLCLIRRAAFDRLLSTGNAFHPDAAPLDDWDFWLRLTRLGDLAFVDRVVLNWRRHDAAGSQNVSAMSAAELRIREGLLDADLPPDLREIAEHRYRKLLVTRQRRDARDRLQASRGHFGAGRLVDGLRTGTQGLASYVGYLRMRT